VSAGAFVPPPKVDSAVICLKPYSSAAFLDKWGTPLDRAEDIMAFASRFFAQPRKKMCGLLNKDLREKCQNALVAIGESPDSRPAALRVEKWVELWKKMR
jgi:16S rRNA A1518/A1519 N6-dimethyltransferase RsmA/KsgA/DIM1 with predicted DNA glycosylase/AP lyase activity